MFVTLKKEMTTHFSTLAWKIPWMEEPGGLQYMGSQSIKTSKSFTEFHRNILSMIIEKIKSFGSYLAVSYVLFHDFYIWGEGISYDSFNNRK